MLERDEIATTILERGDDVWFGHVLREREMLSVPEIGVERLL